MQFNGSHPKVLTSNPTLRKECRTPVTIVVGPVFVSLYNFIEIFIPVDGINWGHLPNMRIKTSHQHLYFFSALAYTFIRDLNEGLEEGLRMHQIVLWIVSRDVWLFSLSNWNQIILSRPTYLLLGSQELWRGKGELLASHWLEWELETGMGGERS